MNILVPAPLLRVSPERLALAAFACLLLVAAGSTPARDSM